MTRRKDTFRSEEGQTLVEYALIIGVVAIGAIVSLGLLGETLSGVFDDVAATVSGALS